VDEKEQVDIILGTHNHIELTAPCVVALYEYTEIPFRLTVVDDSTDGVTPIYFEKLQEKKGNIKYIRPRKKITSTNMVINIGLKNTDSEFVVFLGNSTIVEPKWLNAAWGVIHQHQDIGIIGFKEVYPQGHIEHAGIHFEPGMPHHTNFGVGEPAHRWTHIADVPLVGGCLVLFRRLAVPVGGFDEDYYIGFRGYDDLDNCFQMHENGWRVVYCGLGTAIHRAQATQRADTELEQYAREYDENRFRFLARWGVPPLGKKDE